MQYFVKRELKRFLIISMGVFSGYFSGYGQKYCMTSFDVESGKHDFATFSLTGSIGYHNL